MRPAAELVLHVGLPHTGGAGLGQALRTLRPQLRDHGVAYVPHPDRVKAERRRTATRSGGAQTLLISDDRLLGPPRPPSGHPPGATVPWFPQARVAIGKLISALQPARTTLVLVTRRQDRMLELGYTDEQLAGGDAAFETRLADLTATELDYVELLNRLATLSGADRVEVQPEEALRADRHDLVRLLLGIVGVADQVDLSAVPSPPAEPVPTARGLAVLRALTTETDTLEERRLVRDFVLEGYPSSSRDEPKLLDPSQRQAVLIRHAETNRRLFKTFWPGFEPDGYVDDAATLRLSESPLGSFEDVAAAPARVGIGTRGFRFADRAATAARRRASGKSIKEPTADGPSPAAS